MLPRLTDAFFLILLYAVLCFSTALAAAPAPFVLDGVVLNEDSQPVIGAAVFLKINNQVISGASTDTSGLFTIWGVGDDSTKIDLEVLAIGYENISRPIDLSAETSNIVLSLKTNPVRTSNIIVTPQKQPRFTDMAVDNRVIISNSKHSLIGTDPIQVIKQPQVARSGSNHSSKIRVNGSSPRYYINGFDIGYDPNHYGMFTIIPASIVDQLKFYPQGTTGEYPLPSIIDLSTRSRFEKHSEGEFNLSFIEATGVYSAGTDDFYIISSLRKSMLDKLINKIDNQTTNKRLPPTNFQDFFISTGIKFSENSSLCLDQYYVRDYLYYITDRTNANPNGLQTSQETDDTFLGLRFQSLYDNKLIKVGYGIRAGKENYMAKPNREIQENEFFVDLDSYHEIHQGIVQIEFINPDSRLVIGNRLEVTSKREVYLRQQNWNFLPPDYISDNPYIYQNELNRLYGDYKDYQSEVNNSSFVSYEKIIGRLKIESGIRSEYFGNLSESNKLSYRFTMKYDFKPEYRLKLAYGTYSESPLNRLTEPYQVLIHDFRESLKPINIRLLSLNLNLGSVSINLFDKRIHDMPVLAPDFDMIGQQSFLTMQSLDKLKFYGGDIGFELEDFLDNKLSLELYYGYTHARKYTFGTTQKFNLISPHRFYARFDYRLNSFISFSSEFNIRSGYAYTPSYGIFSAGDSAPYNQGYFSRYLALENTDRFPINFDINLFMDIKFSSFELYICALNVTDHDNPIMNTSDGFIYDMGIIPSLGIRYLF